MEGILRMYNVSNDDGVAAILLFCFLLIAAAFSMGGTFQIFDLTRLLSTKERASIFAKTAPFSRKFNLVLTLQLILVLGLFVVVKVESLPDVNLKTDRLWLYALVAALVLGLYLMVWLKIISLLGRLFSIDEMVKLWTRDFMSLAGATGMVLFCVAVAMIYVKDFLTIGSFLGVALVGLFKLLTIYKGVRLFFNDLYSILYLILYLCALEIIPLLLLRRGVLCLLVETI